MKAKKPKRPEEIDKDPTEAAMEVQPNPATLKSQTQTEEARKEAQRQGWAAAELTGPRGLADQRVSVTSRRLLAS